MRYILILTAAVLLTTGCNKQKWMYTVVARNPGANAAVLEISGESHKVINSEFKQSVYVDEFDVVSMSFDHEATGTEYLTLSIYRGDDLITSVSGNSYMWINLTRKSASKGGGGTYALGRAGAGAGLLFMVHP